MKGLFSLLDSANEAWWDPDMSDTDGKGYRSLNY